MPRLSHCARAGGPTHRKRHIDRPRHPAPQADALSRSAPSRHTPAGVPRAGTPSRRPRVSVPVCRGHETRTRITEHMSPLPAPPRPRRRARAAAPTPPLPVPPLPRSRSAAPGAAVPVLPFPRRHSRTAAALPLRRPRYPRPQLVVPPRAAAPLPPRRCGPTVRRARRRRHRPPAHPGRTRAAARQPRSGGACLPRSARSRSPFDHRIAPASARHPLASGRRRPGRHPRATSVVSAAQPGTGFARAAALRTTVGREREPAARVEAVLPSGAGTAVVATSGARPPGGCSSLIEGSGGPRTGRPTGDRPDAPARCASPCPAREVRGLLPRPHPPRRPGRPRRLAWLAATVRNE